MSGLTHDSPSIIRELAASGNVELVKAAILRKYGIEVTDQYAADLIMFVEEMTSGHQ